MSGHLSYVLFQTRVSTNLALAAVQSSGLGPWDLELIVEPPAAYQDDGSIEWLHQYFIRGTTVLAATSGHEAGGFALRCHGVADFHVTRDGRSVRAVPLPGVSPTALEDAVIGELFPLVLNLRGRNGIHASAVRIADSAVAFCGASRAGKSTIAAYLQAGGCAVLTDDYLGIEDQNGVIVAYPGLGRIRLRADAQDALDRVSPGSREDRPSFGGGFERNSVPLSRIYVLSARGVLGPSDGVQIEPLAGHEAFTEVLQQMYRLDLRDPDMLTRQADLLSRLAARGCIKRLTVGSFDALRGLPDLIRADVAEACAVQG
jgi:hypothetical protein